MPQTVRETDCEYDKVSVPGSSGHTKTAVFEEVRDAILEDAFD